MQDAELQLRAFPKARVVVAATLFLAWLGYLGYLVSRAQDLVVVSRSQAIVAHLVLVGEVRDDNGQLQRTVSVKTVLWSRTAADMQLAGQEIVVGDLPEAHGYDSPGEYLLLLNRTPDGKMLYVTPLPPVPGFPGGAARIYPATEDALTQVRQVLPQ